MFGSVVPLTSTAPGMLTLLVIRACCARKAWHGFDALLQVGWLAGCATCVNRFTVVPGFSPFGPVCVYVKLPCCANADTTGWLVVTRPGCLSTATEAT